MKPETLKGRLLRSSTLTGVAVSAALTGAPAFAQDDVEEIFVTGSRIARPDLTSNSPVTIVDSEALELSGAVNVEQLLHTLPQVIPGLNANSNNPSAQQGPGQVTVDLRGLGSSRTLILVNGRRFTPSGNLGLVDINNVPASLIDRVDVVTGGTSAVYGSDALGGVVNFILKDDFEGVQFSSQVGISGEGDASQYTMDVTMGGNFDRGNAVLYASYFNREGLTQGDRDYSKNTYVGSGTPPQGKIDGLTPAVVGDPDTLSFDHDGLGGLHPWNGCFPGWTCADGLNAYETLETDRYNYAPPNYLILPQDRIIVEGFVTYDINDYAEFFADLAYINSRNEQQLAPTPATDLPLDYDMLASVSPAAAAYLTANYINPVTLNPIGSGDTLNFHRRMSEVGARVGDMMQNTVNITMGFRGDIPWIDGWDYEVYYQYGRNESQINSFNNVNQLAFEDALNGCTLHNVPGCAALMPFNFFATGGLTAAQGQWLGVNIGETSTFERQTIAFLATGDLYELPNGPLQSAIGFEYRKDVSGYVVDNDQRTGNIQGFNQSNSIFGAIDVAELYLELVAPLWPNFEIEGGYRYSQYSTAGSVNTWKVGASWHPIDDIRLRATYNEATRAPNIFELFRAGDQQFRNYTDPCDFTNAPTADQQALCTTMMAPFVYNPATFQAANAQVEAREFGNPDLDPEGSTSLTVGAVIQPRWVDNLTLTIDYYDIEVEDYITNRTANAIVQSCFTQNGASPLDPNHPDCLRVQRDPVGQVATVNTTLGNQSLLETSGVDVSLRYNWVWADTRFFSGLPGDMSFNMLYTYVDEYLFDGADVIGDIAQPEIIPEHKGSARLTYNVNDWQFSWNVDYLDEMIDPYFGEALNTIYYHDLSMRWFPNDTYEASFIISNVTDEQPPTLLTSAFAVWGQGNTVPAFYDPLGRYYRFGLKAKF